MFTVNQIMLLLDVHRGTKTQHAFGSYEKDLDFLRMRHLIKYESGGEHVMTGRGEILVNVIKNITQIVE